MGEQATGGESLDALVRDVVDELVMSELDSDAQVIGHFEVGPPGVGPVADVTTGEFYPCLPAPDGDAVEARRG
jgi:hypothetical protein